jgi:hypothetical protein
MSDPLDFDDPPTWLYMRITEHEKMKNKKTLARVDRERLFLRPRTAPTNGR